MAESSCRFQICSPKLGVQVSVYPVESWRSNCESYDSEVTTIHATVDGPWPGMRLALLFILPSCFILFLVPWSFVLSFVFPFLEFSVAGWRSVNLALPFPNHENGDFWILMREISEFLWERFPEYWKDKSALDKTFNSSKSRNLKKALEST